jgi:hypothetical protein
MAKINEKVSAKITAVVPSKIEMDRFDGKRYENGNYCVVEPDPAAGWQSDYNFPNNSLVAIPVCDRVVGTKGFLVWRKFGSYTGPIWSKV